MERIVMRPLGAEPQVICWHCTRVIDRDMAVHAARYLYRGDQPYLAVVEDWLECECGAYQNVRRMTEITVEPFGKGAAAQGEVS